MKREHRINLRLSDEELEALRKKAKNKKLSSFCREASLNAEVIIHYAAKTVYDKADPEAIVAINRIGNNLNQFMRLAYVLEETNRINSMHFLHEIKEVKEQLAELLEKL